MPLDSLRATVARACPAGLLVLMSVLSARPAAADNGWYVTGSGVRTKTIVLVPIKLYNIRHEMRGPRPIKSRRAVIEADQDKRFIWRFLRDVPCDKMKDALRERFAANGYTAKSDIETFVGACSAAEAKKGATVSVVYDAATKNSTIQMEGLGQASVHGAQAMRAVWSLWLGNTDQPELSDALVANLP